MDRTTGGSGPGRAERLDAGRVATSLSLMSHTIRRLQGRFQLVRAASKGADADLAQAVATGLGAPSKSLPCRFLYDAEGSRLFEAICKVPEYYPTRTERAILEDRAPEIIERVAPVDDVVELGSGNSEKTEVLLKAFSGSQKPVRYVPIDICGDILEEGGRRLVARIDGLEVRAIQAEYQAGLRRLAQESAGEKLVLWLGSNVGNFTRSAAAEFLTSVTETMASGDRLLIGVDLRKDRAVLEAAYDDAQGVTARFNLNLLARINRELDADFDLEGFRHEAVYDEESGEVTMHLVSERDQTASIGALGRSFDFVAGERVHTESSYKYSPGEIGELARAGGTRLEQTWTDERSLYSLNLLAV